MNFDRELISNENPMEAIDRFVNPEWLVEFEVDAIFSDWKP